MSTYQLSYTGAQIDTLLYKIDHIVDLIYPVGSIYISTGTNNPGALFGGTWTRIKDKFILACGDTYANGDTGGAASVSYTPQGYNSGGAVGAHTLTTTEIPSHAHGMNSHTHGAGSYSAASNGAHTHDITKNGTVNTSSGSYGQGMATYNSTWTQNATSSAGAHTHTVSGTSGAASGNTANAGGGGSHDHTFTNPTFTGTAATINTLPPYLAVYVWQRTA